MSDLIERLRKQRPNGECVTIARLMDDAADEIERLTAEVRRLDHSTTHTCWDECPRLACAQRREIEALTAQLARARQEGWNTAIEAADEALKHVTPDDPALDTWTHAWFHIRRAIRALAMPDLIASDADPTRDTMADSDGDDGA